MDRKKIAKELLKLAKELVATQTYQEYMDSLVDKTKSKYRSEEQYNKAMGIGQSDTPSKSDSPSKEDIGKSISEGIMENIGGSSVSSYGDSEEIADGLDEALQNHFGGSSDVNGSDISFYEESTESGLPVNISITVNPSNQPEEDGKTKIGLFIENNAEEEDLDENPDWEGIGITLQDTVYAVDNDSDMEVVAKELYDIAQMTLKKL